jgi:hypothetical protein
MPITWPLASSTGPPLLPWLMGAEIWISVAPLGCRTPLMSPFEIVPSSPSGFPMVDGLAN